MNTEADFIVLKYDLDNKVVIEEYEREFLQWQYLKNKKYLLYPLR